MEGYFGYIYRVDLLDRDAYYIGQRKGGFDPEYFGSGRRIRAYIRKYGTSSLKISMLATAENPSELNSLEKKFIGDLWKTDSRCWNLCEGGLRSKDDVSLSTRQKMSLSRKGKKHSPEHIKAVALANTGKKRTPEQLERMRKSGAFFTKGQVPWNKGMKGSNSHTQESKKAISDKLKGRKLPSEHIEKIRLGWVKRKLRQAEVN